MNAEELPTANAACCPSCRRIFTGSWVPWRVPASADGRWGIYEFHKTLQELRDCASTRSCPVCKIALKRGDWDSADADAEPSFAHIPKKDMVSINITPNGGTSDLERCCFVTLARSQQPPLEWLGQPRIGTSTRSAASHGFIKAKLRNCCESHTLCSGADSGFLPTRMLEVPHARDGPTAAVRLVNGRDVTGKYATLSHCWGQAPIGRLLAANQADFERGVPLETLPTTFRQAIGVVRFLGIPYVWIDSLCIVQDSPTDWEVESAAMAKVYGHALVNIAAASSSDSRGGLFFDRDPDVVQPFTVYTPGGGTLAEGWYTWQDNNRWYRLGEEPLHRRGWVLQERLLSPRTIHFAKSEIVWHCLQDVGSESILTRIPDGPADAAPCPAGQIGDYTDIRTTMAEMLATGVTPGRRTQLERDWKRLIAQYTKCGLTKGGDKLVAVFGIVDRVESLTGDRCLAGLWRSQMPASLLWLVSWGLSSPDGRTEPLHPHARRRPAGWRAPSWSWASHDWAVGYVYHEDGAVRYTEVAGATVVRRQNGSAVCGKLVLRGPVVEVDVGLVCGRIASRECEETLLGRWRVNCLVRTDGPYDSACPARALLILHDWAYLFLLIVPVDPTEAEPLTFRRVGVLVVMTETCAEGCACAAERLCPCKENGELSWSEYTTLIELV